MAAVVVDRPFLYEDDGQLHRRHVGPIETGTGEQHVADERLDGCFAHQPDEEELLDDLRRHGAKRRQPQEQFAETDRLIGVLRPAVLFQGALRLFLQALDVRHIRQSASVCKRRRRRRDTKLSI